MQADKICLKKRNKESVKNPVKGDVLAGKILVNLEIHFGLNINYDKLLANLRRTTFCRSSSTHKQIRL